MSKQNTPYIAHVNDDIAILIVCCQHQHSDFDKTLILSYFSEDSHHYQHIINLASNHGVLPLVYKCIHHLAQTHHTLKPFTVTLKSAYLQIAKKNMRMSAELIRIIDLLHQNNIKALAFKGPTLSQMAYGDITLRQYGDLDILVDEKNIYQVAKLLLNQNYEPMGSIEFLRNTAKRHVEKNYEFHGQKNGMKIEIHWKLINASFLKKFKDYDVFAPQDMIHINNTPLPTLDSKILLLYLCNHGASHMWERLEWIVDIDRLMKLEEACWDWDEILKLASTLQSKTTLLLGLGLAKELFQTKLPSAIVSQMNSTQIATLVNFVLKTFKSDFLTKDHTSHKKNFKVFQFNLTLQDSLLRKVSFILQTFFGYSDRDVMTINLPKALFFLYYPLRILRIINKYTIEPVKNIFSKKDVT